MPPFGKPGMGNGRNGRLLSMVEKVEKNVTVRRMKNVNKTLKGEKNVTVRRMKNVNKTLKGIK
jgi:hypothetical protein